MFHSLELLKKFTGIAYAKKNNIKVGGTDAPEIGRRILEEGNQALNELVILATGFENSNRKVQLIKVPRAYKLFKELIVYYGVSQLLHYIRRHKINSWKQLHGLLPKRVVRAEWKNIGGQLIPTTAVDILVKNIRSGKIKDWKGIHDYYEKTGSLYDDQKFQHAFASLLEISGLTPQQVDKNAFRNLLLAAVATKEWMTKSIYESRAKDYTNEFRKMVYDSGKEMDKVLGKLEENAFINQQKKELRQFKKNITGVMNTLGL